MKTLNTDATIQSLEDIGFNIKSDFLQTTDVVAPLLSQVKIFLASIPEKGLSLTAKGNLPMKLGGVAH